MARVPVVDFLRLYKRTDPSEVFKPSGLVYFQVAADTRQ